MKKLRLLFLSMFIFVSFASAQNENWKFVANLAQGTGTHGLTVTPDGCIWLACYYAGGGAAAGNIMILNPDGTQKTILTSVTVEGTTYQLAAATSARGISSAPDGNVVFSLGNLLYKINYQTYAGMARYEGVSGSNFTNAAFDEYGNVIAAYVVPEPANTDVCLYAAATLASYGIRIPKEDQLANHGNTRVIAMTTDGKDIYLASQSGDKGVSHYRNDGGIWGGEYTFIKHIGDYAGNDGTVTLDGYGRLWIGSNLKQKYECWNLRTMEVVDEIVSTVLDGTDANGTTAAQGKFRQVRGLAFSSDMKYAYTSDFSNGTGIQKWEYVGADVSGTNWEFSKVFYQNANSAVHGVVVTPDNSIWLGLWTANADLGLPSGAAAIFNPDGSLKNAITEVTIDGVTGPIAAQNRGMGIGPDGSVYVTAGPRLVKFDYQTLEQLFCINPSGTNNLTAAAADEFGNVLVSTVSGPSTHGIFRFSEFGEPLGGLAVAPQTPQLVSTCRDLALTLDGKDLFVASTGTVGVTHWHDEDGTFGDGYKFVKVIGEYGAGGQDIYLDKQGRLWIGADANVTGGDGFARYDCWDLNTMDIVDKITSPTKNTFNSRVPDDDFDIGGFATPRGFAISNDGTRVYVADFNTGVLEYKRKGTSDAKKPEAIPTGFALSQNYPNPFNPSTNFKYTLPNSSDVKIVVYDLFGREVKTLVNETKAAGEYTITWNGRDSYNKQVSSGVYFYNMRAGNFTKTMKMMLMK